MQISYPRVPFPGVHYSQALWKLFTLERSCPDSHLQLYFSPAFFILHSTGSFHALPALHLASIFFTWARSGDPLPVPAIGQVQRQNFSQTFTQAVSPALSSEAAPVDCHISGCIPTACSWQHPAVRNNHVCLETKLKGCTHAGTSSGFNPWKAKAFHTGFAHPGYCYTQTTFMLVFVLLALFLMSQPWRLVVLPRNFGHRLRAGAFGRQQIAEGKQENEKMKESEGSNPFLVLLGLDVILAKGGSCGKAFLHWGGEQYSTD